jgi:ATP-dependent DNA helicase RecG
MTSQIDQLHAWMKMRESTNLEFKEAKNGFDSDKLTKYCCALANERGGHLILGVTDKRPRTVVGTHAFANLEKVKSDLITRLHLRVDVEELHVGEKRVLVFTMPSRPIGVPIQCQGIYWMRRGEELVSMTADMLKRIFQEAEPDYTAQICPEAKFDDLDPECIKIFRDMWVRKSGNNSLKAVKDKQLLKDIGAIESDKISYAALILFGKRASLRKHLA